METPSLGRIKDVIRDKGYSNLFEVETSLAKDMVSGEIPLDFLYKIINNPEAIKVINQVMQDHNYVPSPIPDLDLNSSIIRSIIHEINKRNIFPEDAPRPTKSIPSLSKLLFIGIRSKNFGGWYDDLFIATTERGEVFYSTNAHTDLDYGKILPISPSPIHGIGIITMKPGFYMDLFQQYFTDDGRESVGFIQTCPVDLYRLTCNSDNKPNYEQVVRGDYRLQIGCSNHGNSDNETTKGFYAVEFENHNICDELDNIVKKYMNEFYLNQQVHSINGVNTLVIGDMSKFPFLLLEETDFGI